MKIKIFNVAISTPLEVLAMKEGEESRELQFLNKLGLSAEIQAALKDPNKNLDEVVNSYTTSFADLTKTQHLSKWDEEKKAALIKQTQIGTWNGVEKKVSELLGLSLDNYKDVDKGRFDKMLNDHLTTTKSKIEALEKAAKEGKDNTTLQLQTQLEEANAELLRLKEIETTLPQTIAQAKAEVENGYFLTGAVDKAIGEIENILPHIDSSTIKLHINSIAKLGVVDNNGSKGISILDAAKGTPFMESKTSNYKNLSSFILKEVLEPRNWIAKQKPNPNPNPNGGSSGGEGDGGSGKYKIAKPLQTLHKK